MYYFGYASNMNHNQMKNRCPGARFLTWATLKNWSLVYDGHSVKRKGAVANIKERPGSFVLGGLFEIDQGCLSSLDRHEGFPTHYQKREVQVAGGDHKTYRAWTYFRTGRPVGEPSKEYREVIVTGARDCGIPEPYIKANL